MGTKRIINLNATTDFENDDNIVVDSTTAGTRKMAQSVLKEKLREDCLGNIHNLPTTITAFRTGDVIPVDGPSGTAKMSKDDLLAVTAQNAFAGNVAPVFDPDKVDGYVVGESVTYEGKRYTFGRAHTGAWSASHVFENNLSNPYEDFGVIYKSINLNDPTNWRAGGVDTSTGVDDTDKTRITTKPFRFSAQTIIDYTPYQTRSVYCYEDDGTYIGIVSVSGYFIPICKVLEKHPNARIFKISLINLTAPANPSNIVGNTIVFSGIAQVYELDEKIEHLNDDVDELVERTENVVNLNDANNWKAGGIDSGTGEEVTDDTRIHTNLFPFVSSTIVSTTPWNDRYISAYDKDGNYLGYKSGNYSIPDVLATYPSAVYYSIVLMNLTAGTIPSDVIGSTIVFNGTYKVLNIESLSVELKELENNVSELENETGDIETKLSSIFDRTTSTIDLNDPAIWRQGGVDPSDGSDDTDNTRLNTQFIAFTPDTTFSTTPWADRFIAAYDKDKNYLGYKAGNPTIASVLATFPTAVYYKFVLINLTAGTQPSGYIGTTLVFNGTYNVVVFDNIPDKVSNLITFRDRLYGKKWFACGDSFTQGVASYFDDGLYKGQRKSYPFYIGNRTGMNVKNIAVSGSTMSFITGHSEGWPAGCFTYPDAEGFKKIDADTDYITLKFGINDENYNAAIGTINDAVNTTLFGAWNITMAYLLEHFPFAKIGIIVSNGINDTDLADVSRQIAKKWGVPYLDENFGYEVPLLHRVSGKPLVCAAAHQNRLENFRVSSNNTHPNDRAMEFESTFVENFLRSL